MGWLNKGKHTPPLSSKLICDYLLFRFKSGSSTTYVNSIRSAINFFTLSKLNLENDVFIIRLFKYFYKEKPLRARYTSFWPVNKLLEFLKSWHPIQNLSLKQLTLKTIALIALSSSDRGQTIHLASINNMEVSDNKIKFVIRERLKNTRKIIKPTIISCISSKSEDLNVCAYVKDYLERTREFRKDQTQLFISWISKKPVSRTTLARWLKLVLSLAGIDTQKFKAHSYRGAGLSKAFQRGASIHQIVEAGNWSNCGIFKNYYNAPSEPEIGNLILED